MTAHEIRDLAEETSVALLPMGSTEMHGPHLATGVDTVAAEALAEGAARLEKAIVLPAISYNINAPMKCYPGTISSPMGMVAEQLRVICEEVARNGFDRILCTIGHGGTQAVVGLAQDNLLDRKTSKRRSPADDYLLFHVYLGGLCKKAKERVIETRPCHGCEYETSLIMYLRPDLVRKDKIGEPGPILSTGAGAAVIDNWNRVVPLGYGGDPSKATAEKGKALMDEAVPNMAEVIRKVKEYPRDTMPEFQP